MNYIQNTTSNPNYLNFNGTATESANQDLTPIIGNLSDVFKNCTMIVSEEIIVPNLQIDDTIILPENS